MTYLESITQVSEELGLPVEVVKKTYESYWEFIRETIQSLPLKEDLSEEEFNKLRTNFNIPSIGKLSCTYTRYKILKNRFKKYKDLRDDYKNKVNQTDV